MAVFAMPLQVDNAGDPHNFQHWLNVPALGTFGQMPPGEGFWLLRLGTFGQMPPRRGVLALASGADPCYPIG